MLDVPTAGLHWLQDNAHVSAELLVLPVRGKSVLLLSFTLGPEGLKQSGREAATLQGAASQVAMLGGKLAAALSADGTELCLLNFAASFVRVSMHSNASDSILVSLIGSAAESLNPI